MTRSLAGFLVLAALDCGLVSAGAARADGPEAGSSYERIEIAGPTATSEEQAACEAAGGEIRRGGIGGYEHCVQVYPDANRPCTDSSECIGPCLNASETVRDPVSTGRCARFDFMPGCYQPVEDGLGQRYLICAD